MCTFRTTRRAALIRTRWLRIVLLFLIANSAHAATTYFEDLETDLPPDWEVENGVWEAGTPMSGPNSCHTGTQCEGTVLE